MSTLDEIKAQWEDALKSARDIAAKAEQEKREFTGDELAQVKSHLDQATGFKAEYAKRKEQSVDSAEVKSLMAQFANELGLEQTPGVKSAPSGFQVPTNESLGEAFVKSAAYGDLMGLAQHGRFGEKQRVQSDAFGVKSLFKALVTGTADNSAGAFVQTERQNIFELLGRPTLTLRDLVSVRQTGSDSVEYVRQLTQPTNAATVPEATTAAAPTAPGTAGALVTAAGGGYKPEGSITFEKVTASVKTIAEWIPATKRSIADAPQLRSLIDQELKADLAQVEELQMLNGDGSGENLQGILQTSGIQTQAASATIDGLDPLLETTLKAKTKARVGGRTVPNGYLLNPIDWERIQLARLAKNPANEGTAGAIPTLHGLPVVESENIAAGTSLVGDFTRAVLWDREQASVSVTDSHADFFIRNLVAILAEERVAFGVTRPKAFVKVTLPA